VARTSQGWVGDEVDLDDVKDLDGIADLLREIAGDDWDGPALLFVEEDDEWFGVVRLDPDGEPRWFISDSRAVATSEIAPLLYEGAEPDEPAEDGDEDEDGDGSRAPVGAGPAGDEDLLADLGTPARRLLTLCVEEGKLPADVIATLCESAGCLESLEQLRG
jgi:putative tRNA adenosine deaminase-associated protein